MLSLVSSNVSYGFVASNIIREPPNISLVFGITVRVEGVLCTWCIASFEVSEELDIDDAQSSSSELVIRLCMSSDNDSIETSKRLVLSSNDPKLLSVSKDLLGQDLVWLELLTVRHLDVIYVDIPVQDKPERKLTNKYYHLLKCTRSTSYIENCSTGSGEFGILIVQHSLCQDYHEYAKYVVSLRKQREKSFGESHFCAATIIKDDMVLTAGNCALQSRHGKPLWHYKVVTGTPIRTIPSHGTGERPWLYFEVYEVSVDFERTIDLAIIRVTPSFNLGSDAVAVVQLALDLYEGGEECYVGGWGDQRIGYDDHISFDKVTLSSDSTCIEKHPTYRFDITCASNSFDPVCKMDWGGPLICAGKLAAVLVGSEYCGEKKPCIYYSVKPVQCRKIKNLPSICNSAVMKCKLHVQLDAQHSNFYWAKGCSTDNIALIKTREEHILDKKAIIKLAEGTVCAVIDGSFSKTNVVQVQSTVISNITCVGARIGDYLILTAAQCFTDEYPPYSVVTLGDKKYQARYVLRHAEFRGGQRDNIGVIKIREYISTDDLVITQHAQEPQDANVRCMVDDGKFSTVTEFGICLSTCLRPFDRFFRLGCFGGRRKILP
uniref:Peptidase S1 domain-containing protein n=1 Tax=Glossina austeni TaxID=7395 RepID=A0A1A9V194_GLOAU